MDIIEIHLMNLTLRVNFLTDENNLKKNFHSDISLKAGKRN